MKDVSDTLPLLDGYSGYDIHFASYLGAGIGALFGHNDGCSGAGLCKSILVLGNCQAHLQLQLQLQLEDGFASFS